MASIVELVTKHGDNWRTGPVASVERAKESAVMLSCERVRCAGIPPVRRVLWREYIERERRGEWHGLDVRAPYSVVEPQR